MFIVIEKKFGRNVKVQFFDKSKAIAYASEKNLPIIEKHTVKTTKQNIKIIKG